MYFETTFSDATEQETSLPGWLQEYRQVSTGGYDGRVSAILLPGVEILRETISVGTEQLFSAPEESVVFYYYPRRDSTVLARGERPRGASGFALNWTNRIGFMDANSDLLMLVLRRDAVAFEGIAASSGLAEPPTEHATFLAEWLLSLLAIGGQPAADHAHGNIENVLADMIKDRFELLLQRSVLREEANMVGTERIYGKIRDRLHDEPDVPHTVRSLSRDLGISPEKLRRSCHNFTQIPLDKMLTLLRLNGARRDLLRCRGSMTKVSDIAMEWGFFHWSRFAQRYRMLFGETPSQTMRN